MSTPAAGMPPPHRRAFTLIEMVCAVAVIAVVAMLAAGAYGRVAAKGRIAAAESDMAAISNAFTDPEAGILRDLGCLPGFAPASLRIANLLVATNVWGETLNSSLPVRMDDPDGRGQDARAPRRAGEGVAVSSAWTEWDESTGRGWRGPYFKSAKIATFPSFERANGGFYPDLRNIRVPDEFADRTRASIYAFAGEAAILDPWGNPYVLQVPPPQAFTNVTGVTSAERFRFARIVSAGPDGVIDTPCYEPNGTNSLHTTWNRDTRRRVRMAGRERDGSTSRGDDLVRFLIRNDVYEDEDL